MLRGIGIISILFGLGCGQAADEWRPDPEVCHDAPWNVREGCEDVDCVEGEEERALAAVFLEEAAATEWGEALQVSDASRMPSLPHIFVIGVIVEIDWFTARDNVRVDFREHVDPAEGVRQASREFLEDLGTPPQLADPADVLAAGRGCHGSFEFDPCASEYRLSVLWTERQGDVCQGGTESRVVVDIEDATVMVCEVDEAIDCTATTG
jgi:hypothetical protein